MEKHFLDLHGKDKDVSEHNYDSLREIDKNSLSEILFQGWLGNQKQNYLSILTQLINNIEENIFLLLKKLNYFFIYICIIL